ncbi:hypothetical protein [Arthrobacter sp. A5]|uniref:hypothetical protein n=1 Tax=Arthrobacter sp. A5 TaxID=576926 RepID=UPI003DA7BA89
MVDGIRGTDGGTGTGDDRAEADDDRDARQRAALRAALAENQREQAEGKLSTLERVQKLMTSDAFTSYATFGRAGTDPESADPEGSGPTGDGKGPLPDG